jgi:hypothetical protein
MAATASLAVCLAACSSGSPDSSPAATGTSAPALTDVRAATTSEQATLPAAQPTTKSTDVATGEPATLPTGVAPAGTSWTPVATAQGAAVIWTTTFGTQVAGTSVRVSAAVMDTTLLRAALYNGYQMPGAGPWRNSDHVQPAALASLVATFNSGFLFQHYKGGYMTEGVTVRPLVDGQATLGIRKDGRLVLGVYGRDITDDGSYVSLRQNLPPMVDHGAPSIDQYPGTFWGDDFHNIWVVARSAVCSLADGRLMYVAAYLVDVAPFAQELAAFGCQTAMELDVNGNYPHFAWYSGFGTSQRHGQLLDPSMNRPDWYLQGYKKDFIALFDPSTLPAGVVA